MLRVCDLRTLILVGGILAPSSHGQQPAPLPNEFRVDGHCRIYETVNGPNGPKQHTYKDRGICSVDDVHVSSRTETDMDVANRTRIHVTIREHTFTFHNPTSEPASFVLEQAVPKGWEIDSDPQPNKVEGNVATFLISAGPRQTINLHVGERTPPQ